jgi:hypothetical protein
MPSRVGCLALLAPRVAIVLVALFSDFIGRAYETFVWPLLGFFFMPLTTLAYACAINWHGSVSDVYFVVVLVAALMDLGFVGGAAKNRRHLTVASVRRGRGGGGPGSGKVYDAKLDE